MQCQTSARLPEDLKSNHLDQRSRVMGIVMEMMTAMETQPMQRQNRNGKRLSPTLNLTKMRLPLLLEQGARMDLKRTLTMKHMVAAAVKKKIEIDPQTRVSKNTQMTKNENRRHQIARVSVTSAPPTFPLASSKSKAT